MENEFKKKYKVNKEHMDKYPVIISQIQKRLSDKSIDISDVIERYKNGMGIEHIKTIFKLTEDEMEYIRSKYISETIENTRKLNVEKWSKGYTSALPKEDLGDYKPPKNKLEAYINLQNAIKLVEGVER